MPDERKFTLYSEASFALGLLPVGADRDQFWDDLAGKVEADTGGETRVSREASGRVLRVLYTESGIVFAYHYGIHLGPDNGGRTIRLQPQTAWHVRSGSGDTEPMLAIDARGNLSVLRKQLVDAADEVLP